MRLMRFAKTWPIAASAAGNNSCWNPKKSRNLPSFSGEDSAARAAHLALPVATRDTPLEGPRTCARGAPIAPGFPIHTKDGERSPNSVLFTAIFYFKNSALITQRITIQNLHLSVRNSVNFCLPFLSSSLCVGNRKKNTIPNVLCWDTQKCAVAYGCRTDIYCVLTVIEVRKSRNLPSVTPPAFFLMSSFYLLPSNRETGGICMYYFYLNKRMKEKKNIHLKLATGW
jgi:hypothetical protein